MNSSDQEPSEKSSFSPSEELRVFREFWKTERQSILTEDQAWWDSLSEEERARAFRKVASLIYYSEVVERGTYRHAMYETFKIDYSDGLLCNYMELHNLIQKALENQGNK